MSILKLDNFNLTVSDINIYICESEVSPPHAHEFLELGYVMRGRAVHMFNGTEEQIISEGDYFIIDYRMIHSYRSLDGELAVINCLFLPRLIDKSLAYCESFETLLRHYLIQIGDRVSGMAGRIFRDKDGRVLAVLKQMLEEYGENDVGMYEILRLKMIEILILTARMMNKAQVSDVVAEIKEEAQKNYNLTLSQIAENRNYSLPYISKLFKERTGLTFSAYLQKLRMDEACRLLANTDEKIWSISNTVGYTDTDFFRKVFNKHMGVTPGEFRERIRKLKTQTLEYGKGKPNVM